MLKEISFVDKILFGGLTNNSKVSEYKDYKQFYNDMQKLVIDFCEQNNKHYFDYYS